MKKRGNAADNMTKADVVERVVELLHNDPNVTLKRKAKVPSRNSPKDTREIDVLATTNLLGRQIHLAFECKNYAKPLGIEKIDEFKGKLEDVGIPVQHGILVSINGFSRNAENRAASIGMRLLLLEGLTESRLQAEVHDAFQSIVYLLLDVVQITVTSKAAEGDPIEFLFLRDENGNFCGGILDLIWSEWRDGNIETGLGEHEISVNIPPNWRWVVQGKDTPSTVKAKVRVRGIVLTIKGRAERLVLRDAASGKIDRGRISTNFDIIPGTYPITMVDSETELQEELDQPSLSRITIGRIPLPRIRYNVYWPPSDRVLLEVKQRAIKLMEKGEWNPGVLSAIPFSELEGTDLSTIWEPISTVHPASNDQQWPWLPRRSRHSHNPSAPNKGKRRPVHRRSNPMRGAAQLDGEFS